MKKTQLIKLLRQSTDPEWQFHVETDWLCAYCGEVGARERDGREFAEAMAQHLRKRCRNYLGGEGQTMSPGALQICARRITLKRKVRQSLRTDAAWQIMDRERYWVCPFCETPTDARIARGGKVGSSVISLISNHISHCFRYDRGRGKPCSASGLKRKVEKLGRLGRMTDQIRDRVGRSKAWRATTQSGVWICPYCSQAIDHITIPSRLVLLEQAPSQIAAHLHDACPEFDLTAMGQGTERAPQDQSAAKLPKLNLEEVLKQDIEDVKAHVAEQPGTKNSWSTISSGDLDVAPGASLPPIPGMDTSLFFRAAKGMAGDFFEALPAEGGVLLLFGDVSGDDEDTGVVVEMARSLLRIHQEEASGSPARLLQLVNRDLCRDLESKSFTSVFLASIDLESRTYTYARAGYPPPLLIRHEPVQMVKDLAGEGLVLGVDTGEVFDNCIDEESLHLSPGDFLVHMSPGVLNLKGPEGAALGREAFRCLAVEYSRHEAEYLTFKINSFVDEFQGGESLRDDLIVLALRVL